MKPCAVQLKLKRSLCFYGKLRVYVLFSALKQFDGKPTNKRSIVTFSYSEGVSSQLSLCSPHQFRPKVLPSRDPLLKALLAL